uniref:Acetylornithine deacetylase/succinyl-diaminopimelate desuccinylase and related deacylases n=1 Tax=Haliea sp. ETY-M TaxID=1055105 RepID=A0A455R743_9GAMM|nr:acetylornithine deacetylase/succinyl-diaminopimelate desuccinylase and related deacylases [Haliea sp. ETY-M]
MSQSPLAVADQVADETGRRFEHTLERLQRYLTIPAISCEEAHFPDVGRICELVAAELRELGFESTDVRSLPGALPLVSATWRTTMDAPTLLIYGHLDLQPVVNEPWDTPPHEGVIRDGRLYARGSADDMGGWISHLAALEAWLAVDGEPPLNIRLILEGEEEIGSPNLEAYMDAYPEDFAADAMVLTDCENPSTEIPGLTTSLRGLLELELVCEALTSDVHSGLWGNAAPDASMALVKLLARIVDEDGRLCVGRVEVAAQWKERAKEVPLDASVVRVGGHVRDDVQPLPQRDRSYAEWIWRQPSVTVLSTNLPAPGNEKNALRASASAVLSFRVAPGQTREALKEAVEAELLRAPPGGVRVSLIERPGAATSWLYEPLGPVFAAADRAYKKAWGHPLMEVGVGGSIPFVAMFGERFSDLPLILNGVMDPRTGAHGPNESMDLEIFRKAILANVYLYAEIADTLRAPAVESAA